jgi:hypothetical protein
MHHHRFAAAVAGRDAQRLAEALSELVRLRALLPGGLVESRGRADVVALFQGWFVDFDGVELAKSAAAPVADRLLIHYGCSDDGVFGNRLPRTAGPLPRGGLTKRAAGVSGGRAGR